MTLDDLLKQRADLGVDRSLHDIITALAAGAAKVAMIVSRGGIDVDLGRVVGSGNKDGDRQKVLDLLANDIFIQELGNGKVSAILSEELDDVLRLDEAAPYAVAIDPLDGSANIDINMPIGTIFSIMPSAPGPLPAGGRQQVAAGFVLYGPQTTLVLSTGKGVDILVLERSSSTFRLSRANVRIPEGSSEYAINAANRRHWPEPVRSFVEDCEAGTSGPLRMDLNMRWVASLVADAYRILNKGGLYLYPGDRRPDYGLGRLRLAYEANPIAFIIEQAGGMATNGASGILDVAPEASHQRTPLAFGSRALVETFHRYVANASPAATGAGAA